jgi:hypothetical protein
MRKDLKAPNDYPKKSQVAMIHQTCKTKALHSMPIADFSFTADGQNVVTAGIDKIVCLVDLEN